MQFTVTTNYILRILALLISNQNKGSMKSSEIADKLNISPDYIIKSLRPIVKAKMVIVEVGKNGGYRINPSKRPIHVFEVMKITEPTMKISNCLDSEKKCSGCSEGICPMKNFWLSAQEKIEQSFITATVDELVEQHYQ